MSVTPFKLGSVFSAGSKSQWQTLIGGNGGVDVNPAVPLPLEDSGTLTQSLRFENENTFPQAAAYIFNTPPVFHSVTNGESPSGTSVVVTKPSGAVEGDVLVAFLNVGDESALAPTSTGWTERASPQGDVGEFYQLYTFTRTVEAGDGATYTFTLDASYYCAWFVTRWSNVDTAAPIDVYSTNDGNSNTRTGLSITTTGDNRQLLLRTSAFDNTISTPSGMTNISVVLADGVYREVISSAGATGNRTAVMGAGSDYWAAQMVALAPDPNQQLTATSCFNNTNTFYDHTLTLGGGGSPQALTQTARFDDTNTFYTHTLSTSTPLTQSARFDNSATFYTHVLTPGAVTLTQSARFDDADTFYTHVLTPGAVALTQSSRFDNAATFYTHVLTQGLNLTQSARFDNSNTFYTHTLTPGAVALTQSSRFDNSQTFYTHALSATYALSQSARFDDADGFYTHVLTPTYALAQSARFDNAATFYTHTLSSTVGLSQSARFDNANTFFAHTLTAGAVALTQSARFDNANTFYGHVLNQVGGPQNLNQGSRLDNANTFYTHVLTNAGGDTDILTFLRRKGRRA
jgi:hypothetical protein